MYTPRQYQLEGARFLRARRYAMLGDAPGVGKTGQAIIAMKPDWYILIVCPATIKHQWQKALAQWNNIPSRIVSTSRDTINIMKHHVTIMSYDLLYREPILQQLLRGRFDLIVYDESHKLKNPQAKRTKIALSRKYLFSRASRIWFLTGTPVKNRTVDLWPILKTCAPEVLGPYDKYLKFAYRYCGAYKGKFGLDTSGHSHTEELHENMKSFMLRREKRDVLTELPPRIVSKIELECTPTARKLIEEEEQKTMERAGEDDPALFKLGEQVRIRKVLATYKVKESVDYIKDLLEEEDKIVVFYYHKEVLNALRRAFEDFPHLFIDGSTDSNKRSGIVEVFRSQKEIRLFFGQMQASGEGIDGLQEVSSCCVFVEPSWSHTDMEQCIGRLERSGQRNDINVHILVIRDTIESRMMDVVAEKINVDKKLYNQKEEKTMAKKKEPMERIADAIEVIATAINRSFEEPAPAAQSAAGVVKAAPEPVAPPEEEIDEAAIRARAADVCNLEPSGQAKTEVVSAIKEICGGKISDLKTAAQKKKAMAALDALYNKYDV